MPGMWSVTVVVAVVVLLAAYLLWIAHRVARMHERAQSAERALDAHLMRRAAAAAVVGEATQNVELYAVARLALDADPDERESAENDLTRQLQAIRLTEGDPATRTLLTTSRRVVVARQVHTDLVRGALTSRERLLVRALGMARRYPRPQYFDIEEPVMPALPLPAAPPSQAAPLEAV
ncbi:hypothetical protein HH310_09460 [Actinoplanes sp. TBRC 11911]|uniref:hypothetical protein n=1 Tax=Actinoplanes sp. TBRC 11911 TaxID=2729386 RepID=UPI00145C627C|nr:hypothetical protein [Actinoplanes sp. TBRC 11911]NMO51416.1 hypothetical protein [Actinoplanes sp. TBRC 11911]